MLHIVFEYRDEFSKGKWRKQECLVATLEQCIEFYGLNECEHRILSVEEV